MLPFIVLVVASYQLAGAQAPGDISRVCVALRAANVSLVPYPARLMSNVRPLMDSRDYENLLPDRFDPVWQRVDNDSNNTGSATTVNE